MFIFLLTLVVEWVTGCGRGVQALLLCIQGGHEVAAVSVYPVCEENKPVGLAGAAHKHSQDPGSGYRLYPPGFCSHSCDGRRQLGEGGPSKAELRHNLGGRALGFPGCSQTLPLSGHHWLGWVNPLIARCLECGSQVWCGLHMCPSPAARAALVKSRDMHWSLLAQRGQRDVSLSSLRMLIVADGANPCE